jgi:ABC-type nitrate/sulfonate/bicarbonate transport system permease component
MNAVTHSSAQRNTVPRIGFGGVRLVLSMLARLVISVLGLLITLGIWELAGRSIGRYFPSPQAVVINAFDNFNNSHYLRGLGLPRGGYLPHLLSTTRTVVEGVVLGCSIGLIAGFASFRWRIAEQVFDPLISIFGTLPIIVAAPFFLIWFGLMSAAQVLLVTVYTFTIFYLYVLRAARGVDVKYLEYARTLGARDALAFRQIILPAMLPEAFGGIRVAFASAWGLAAVSELLGARFGVGRVIVTLATVYDVAGMVALILLLSLVAIVIDALIVFLRAYLTRWSATERGA